ncbi:MAG: sensor histidine kinase, partial [Flavobacteriales bacterium]
RISNDPRNAIRAQEKAIRLTPKSNHQLMAEQLVALARVVGDTDDDMRAELAYHEAYHYALNNNLNPVAEKSARLESRWQESRGNVAKAYERLKSADSLATFNSLSEISSLKRQVSEKRMHSEAYLQDARDARTQMEQERDSNFWNIIIIGIVCFAIVLIFFTRDLTQKRKLSKVLEWKVYKRTRELRKANKELNTYIYKSSHDLRTPLTSIKSLIRLLDKEEHNASTKKYMGLISSCTDQMDDILINLSRAVDFKKVDVKVEQIDFNKIKFDLESKELVPALGLDIKWEINQTMPFFSDYKLLKVILNRTIKNAIDYRKGSSLDFCKILITTDNDGAVLCIEDNGQGVSEKVKDKIFDMFVKGTNKSKGAGLGLYLVKIACDKIKGKVHLENNQHSGATLIFRLPNLEQSSV